MGHTISPHIHNILPAVHPHIRGAYVSKGYDKEAFTGSSPHTWGIRVHHPKTSKPLRFIPTYVGHTVDYGIIIARKSVHPHIRGAYTSSIVRQHGRAVHPHIRGAYHYFLSPFSSSNGSSPHTWGIHWDDSCLGCLIRFIPTYVGHTNRKQGTAPCLAVHPHIRGAYMPACSVLE